MNYKVTQFGKELDKSLYTFDEETKTFTTTENNLVLDFNGIDGITFYTGSNCIFKAGYYCTFNTGFNCIFKTGSNCIFNTGYYCIFDTGSSCIFNTKGKCIVIRRDIYEIIELKENVKIKLNGYGVKGYTQVEDTIKIKTEDEKLLR